MRGGGEEDFVSSQAAAMHILHVKVQIGLGGEDDGAELALGDPLVDAHVIVEGVLVGVALLTDLAAELLHRAGAAPCRSRRQTSI